MKLKKIRYMFILSILIIICGVILIFTQTKVNSLSKLGSDDNYMLFKINNIKKKKKDANILVRYDDEGKIVDEFKIKQKDTVNAFKMGNHKIKIVKITNDYVTISLDDLAPTKKDGTFSLTKKYKNVVIKKNTGLQLNIQATDLYKGYIYFFYVSN